MERYLRVNLFGPGPRLMEEEFTGTRSHKGSETLAYQISQSLLTTPSDICLQTRSFP